MVYHSLEEIRSHIGIIFIDSITVIQFDLLYLKKSYKRIKIISHFQMYVIRKNEDIFT